MSLLAANRENTTNLERPTQLRMDALATEIRDIREKLQQRVKIRQK